MYIKVHVYPNLRKETIKKVGEHQYEFVLSEPAARNLANQRTKELIGELYGIDTTSVRQVTGHHSPSKIFTLPD